MAVNPSKALPMFGYHKIRFLSTLAILAALLAAYRWYRINDMVSRSPYWAQSPSSAKEFGVFIDSVSAPDHLSASEGISIPIAAIWREHSYSYRRTSPFTAAAVVNQDQAVHVLFSGNELVRRNIRDGWMVRLDSEQFTPVLASTGTLIGPISSGPNNKHRLAVVSRERVIAECEFAFSAKQ